MLTKIEGLPDYVAAFTATGEVNKADYENMVIPEIDRVDKLHGHIHFLYVLQTTLKNFSAGAWLEDMWVGIKHYRGWKKIAIVSDEDFVKGLTSNLAVFIPGKTKTFKLAELEAAKKWVAEEE